MHPKRPAVPCRASRSRSPSRTWTASGRSSSAPRPASPVISTIPLPRLRRSPMPAGSEPAFSGRSIPAGVWRARSSDGSDRARWQTSRRSRSKPFFWIARRYTNAGVVARRDRQFGHVPVAAIVLRDVEAVRRRPRAPLPRTACAGPRGCRPPSTVSYAPRTATGKLQRAELRARLDPGCARGLPAGPDRPGVTARSAGPTASTSPIEASVVGPTQRPAPPRHVVDGGPTGRPGPRHCRARRPDRRCRRSAGSGYAAGGGSGPDRRPGPRRRPRGHPRRRGRTGDPGRGQFGGVVALDSPPAAPTGRSPSSPSSRRTAPSPTSRPSAPSRRSPAPRTGPRDWRRTVRGAGLHARRRGPRPLGPTARANPHLPRTRR